MIETDFYLFSRKIGKCVERKQEDGESVHHDSSNSLKKSILSIKNKTLIGLNLVLVMIQSDMLLNKVLPKRVTSQSNSEPKQETLPHVFSRFLELLSFVNMVEEEMYDCFRFAAERQGLPVSHVGDPFRPDEDCVKRW